MEAPSHRWEFGGSMQVEKVQNLAASAGEIPRRYIRPEIKADLIHDGHCCEVPVIDLQRLLDPEFSQEEADNLHLACEEWGFFQLVNHGILDEVTEKMKADIIEFFKLPLAEKEAFSQLPGDIEGYGQAFVTSEDQKLDWGDMFYLTTQPLPFRKLRFWPTHPPTFRETMEKYSLEVKRVATYLLGTIAKNLGLSPEKLTGMFKDGIQSMRINYYPPCSQADKVLGLSPHSDAVGLTLLLQVNEAQGLQIRKNGGWIPVTPVPGAFIVNIGDILEIMSNGKYKSIEHRAIVNTQKERLSVAAFHTLNCGMLIGPIPELVQGNEVYYKSLEFEPYLRQLFASKLEGKNILDSMKLKK